MNINKIINLTESFYKGEMPSSSKINELKKKNLNFKIPLDYLEFISLFDGAEGAIGVDGFLAIWKIDDVIDVNLQYDDDPVFGKYFIFGSSGGTFHYAFNKDKSGIYELDLYEDTYFRFMGNSLIEFLETKSK